MINKVDLEFTNNISQKPNNLKSNKSKGFDLELKEAVKNTNTKNTNTDTKLNVAFKEASNKYDVPMNLLKAVAKAESGFDAKAVSHCGARGIMQLMPKTAEALGVKDSFDAKQNIMGGAKYLSQMLDKYDGNTKLALAAYNAGAGNVAKYGGIPPFKETKNYVVKVMNYMKENIDTNDNIDTNNNTINNTLNETNDSKEVNNNIISDIEENEYTYDDYLVLLEELQKQLQLIKSNKYFDIINLMEENSETIR